MPYPEFKSWQMFYLIEPWGWEEAEYQLGAILSMLFNINRGKTKAKSIRDFMRDPAKALVKELARISQQTEFEKLSPEEKREFLLQQIRKDFGVGK